MRPDRSTAIAATWWAALSVAAFVVAQLAAGAVAGGAAVALLVILPGLAATTGQPQLTIPERLLAAIVVSLLEGIAVVGAILVTSSAFARSTLLAGLVGWAVAGALVSIAMSTWLRLRAPRAVADVLLGAAAVATCVALTAITQVTGA